MPRADLLEHLQSEHAHDYRPAVCPVCAAMPWGDPNYESPNLIAHFMMRARATLPSHQHQPILYPVELCLLFGTLCVTLAACGVSVLCSGHRFDYDTTTDFATDEDSVLAEVLRRSCEEQ